MFLGLPTIFWIKAVLIVAAIVVACVLWAYIVTKETIDEAKNIHDLYDILENRRDKDNE